ncbi:MAG: transporter substrate-binding domain-containing protein [Pseudomonadota bacterium]
MTEALASELAPTGVLRVALNMRNELLVSGREPNGEPAGVSPDMGREIARRLGVEPRFIEYPDAGAVADAVIENAWDIGAIGAEPQRAEWIAFTPAYCEIEATYLLPAGSPIARIEEVDEPGRRIAVMGRAAYGLWLERNLKNAELVRADTHEAARERFLSDGLDALAGLRTRLIADAAQRPGARLLDGRFTAVQQAIGTPSRNTAGAVWLTATVEALKRDGFVGGLIRKHAIEGLSVAPAETR